MSSFEDHRQQAQDNTRRLIARVQTVDHQVSDIKYQILYYPANTDRLETVPIVIVLPSRAGRISLLTSNKLPLKRQRTRLCGLAAEAA